MSYTNLVEKVGAIFFNLSPMLVLLTWKFGPTQFAFSPLLGGAILTLLLVLYGLDLVKKKTNSLTFGLGLIFHGASVLTFILFLFSNGSFYNLAIFFNLLSFNLFVPVRNYEDMVNYVKTHQKTRGFESALILEDLDFKNNVVSPLDIAITKTLFLKFFTGDFFSSKQSAILSFNLSTVVLVYLFAFIPTGSSFLNLLILVLSYAGAFLIGLSIRTLIAAGQFRDDLILETKSYLRIADKPASILEAIRKGAWYNAAYGIFLSLFALSIRGEARSPVLGFNFDLIDWASFLFFPFVLLFTYPMQRIWKSVTWDKLKVETKSKTKKKGKKKKKS